MRHINFDESSVLKEFVKIANDKGMVKSAEEVPQSKGEVAGPPEETRTVPEPETRPDVGKTTADDAKLKEALQKYPAVDAVYAGKRPKGGLQALYQQSLKFFPEIQAGMTNAGFKALAGDIVQSISKFFHATTLPPEKKKAIDAQLVRITGLGKKQQPADDMKADAALSHRNTKSAAAEEKNYDVTGETGEDLVETAHPGGGTKTEVSHSKTNENLVETIVEEQKRNIETVRKVPKGTYAALKTLHERLNKMGHGDKLAGIESIMKKVATTDEVVADTLIRLADKLDGMGKRKAADLVDGWLKKKVAVTPGIEEWGGSWVDESGEGGEYTGKSSVHVGDPIIEDGGEDEEEPGLEPIPEKERGNQKVKRWQKYYNAAIKGSNLPPLAVDGLKGPQTRAAMSTVRKAGVSNLREFGELARRLRSKSLIDLRTALMKKPDVLMNKKTPPRPPEYPKQPGSGRGAYNAIKQRLENKFEAVDLDDPRFKNLADTVRNKVRDLYTIRDPQKLQEEIGRFVNSISGTDIIQSMSL